MSFELPKLDYAKNALAPIMSEETLDLHHDEGLKFLLTLLVPKRFWHNQVLEVQKTLFLIS